MTKPSHLAITMAALGHRYSHQGWLCAGQISANLRLLGFEVGGSQIASTLTHMCTVEFPWLERRESYPGEYEYRVTRFGINDIDNRMQGLTAHAVSGFGVAA